MADQLVNNCRKNRFLFFIQFNQTLINETWYEAIEHYSITKYTYAYILIYTVLLNVNKSKNETTEQGN